MIQQQSKLEVQLFHRILRLKGRQDVSLQFLSNFNRKTPYCKYCTTKMLTKKSKLTILGTRDKGNELPVF